MTVYAPVASAGSAVSCASRCSWAIWYAMHRPVMAGWLAHQRINLTVWPTDACCVPASDSGVGGDERRPSG